MTFFFFGLREQEKMLYAHPEAVTLGSVGLTPEGAYTTKNSCSFKSPSIALGESSSEPPVGHNVKEVSPTVAAEAKILRTCPILLHSLTDTLTHTYTHPHDSHTKRTNTT